MGCGVGCGATAARRPRLVGVTACNTTLPTASVTGACTDTFLAGAGLGAALGAGGTAALAALATGTAAAGFVTAALLTGLAGWAETAGLAVGFGVGFGVGLALGLAAADLAGAAAANLGATVLTTTAFTSGALLLDAEATGLAGFVAFSAADFNASLLGRLSAPAVAWRITGFWERSAAMSATWGVIPFLVGDAGDKSATSANGLSSFGLGAAAGLSAGFPGNSPNPCKSETNSMGSAQRSVVEAPHYVRHWSRP